MWNLPNGTQFLPYSIAGGADRYAARKTTGQVFKIVHAPTDRARKGSDAVITACSQLQKKIPGRLQLELRGRNILCFRAIGIYAQVDLIVDQLRLGWYGAFAVEAMKWENLCWPILRKRDLSALSHPK